MRGRIVVHRNGNGYNVNRNIVIHFFKNELLPTVQHHTKRRRNDIVDPPLKILMWIHQTFVKMRSDGSMGVISYAIPFPLPLIS